MRDDELYHKGIKGAKWGFTKGKRNGKRTADDNPNSNGSDGKDPIKNFLDQFFSNKPNVSFGEKYSTVDPKTGKIIRRFSDMNYLDNNGTVQYSEKSRTNFYNSTQKKGQNFVKDFLDKVGYRKVSSKEYAGTNGHLMSTKVSKDIYGNTRSVKVTERYYDKRAADLAAENKKTAEAVKDPYHRGLETSKRVMLQEQEAKENRRKRAFNLQQTTLKQKAAKMQAAKDEVAARRKKRASDLAYNNAKKKILKGLTEKGYTYDKDISGKVTNIRKKKAGNSSNRY